MKIGFVVNDVSTEQAIYTTTRLAMTATNLGHDAWIFGMGDFGYEPDGTLSARARGGAKKTYRSLERYLQDVQKPETEERVALDDFDVVMLRSDPADDANSAAWANNAGVAFGELIASSGVPGGAISAICTRTKASPMICSPLSGSRRWMSATRP